MFRALYTFAKGFLLVLEGLEYMFVPRQGVLCIMLVPRPGRCHLKVLWVWFLPGL